MRLINTKTHKIESFPRFGYPDIPPYAILSHRWGADEVSLQEMQGSSSLSLTSKLEYQKILNWFIHAASFGFEYVWIDTCCIDKRHNVELTEAINSMFNWYRDAVTCYAYSADVQCGEATRLRGYVLGALRRSNWFTRGWTLQELLAPRTVAFYDADWKEMGPN